MGDRNDNSDGCTVYVGSLSFDAKEEHLTALFQEWGEIMKVKVIVDRETQRARGFGFVTYATSSEANNAVENADGKEIEGRVIRCSISKPKAPGGGGGGYRGGQGGGGFGGGGYGGQQGGGGGGYRGSNY